jgi:SulP family sulfate permease
MFALLPRAADFRASPDGLMRDVVASLTVAVVALPLGFGLTSGMSASAGLTTAIHVYGVQAIPLLA